MKSKHSSTPIPTEPLMQQQERRLGPVIPRATRKTHTDAGLPLTPYPAQIIKIHGNSKTDPNICDTVKGCAGRCWGCYARTSMGVTFGRIDFDTPVSQILDRSSLRMDCMNLMFNRPDLRWVRIGVQGDPSFDWPLTVDTAEVIAGTGLTPVIITKFWRMPTHAELTRLAIAGAVVHWSVIPGYDEHPDVSVRSRRILDTLFKLHQMSDLENIFIRLCTFLWDRSTPGGATLWEAQEYFANEAKRHGWRILETPWKMEANDPRWEFVDRDQYEKAHSYANPEKEGRKQTAGAIYFTGDPYKEKDTWAIGCVTNCNVCPNQCGTETTR